MEQGSIGIESPSDGIGNSERGVGSIESGEGCAWFAINQQRGFCMSDLIGLVMVVVFVFGPSIILLAAVCDKTSVDF